MNPAAPSAAGKLGIYVQVPFCQAKCSYCNFPTGVFSPHIYGPYADALCREIRGHADLYRGAGLAGWNEARPFELDTLYVGGGTPSLLEPAYLARILEAVRDTFPGAIAEATLEADPETVTDERARAWRDAGFQRISLGGQSFHDAELKSVGRRHRRADIFTAAQRLAGAGFDNLSFDLIAGLPHQTMESWRASLDELLGLRPVHVSIYILELDEASRLGRETLGGGRRYGVGSLPSDDQMADFYEFACERLPGGGYEHYEISNWALPGFRSRHNLKYWRREPYLGFGAGAHSFDGQERWANAHDPAVYLAAMRQGQLALEGREAVDSRQALEEELFLGLRQLDGIDLGAIERRYQVRLSERVNPLAAEGLVEMSGGRLRLAPSRLAVSNEVFVRLLD
ncbi:MAG TPA: radical SAM family heme chaperone HemW [Patescibacteria group bacterium]|nr:radical SAM family heme chaperone HemW [Patescibacteria group bacterium]